mmetsp:Transcript_64462/g.165868  ORF Transcript_64462/g.165868 Transcript_64462/m.165868 type:complete len:395 (-) Transcript_64462:1215-2399(-)
MSCLVATGVLTVQEGRVCHEKQTAAYHSSRGPAVHGSAVLDNPASARRTCLLHTRLDAELFDHAHVHLRVAQSPKDHIKLAPAVLRQLGNAAARDPALAKQLLHQLAPAKQRLHVRLRDLVEAFIHDGILVVVRQDHLQGLESAVQGRQEVLLEDADRVPAVQELEGARRAGHLDVLGLARAGRVLLRLDDHGQVAQEQRQGAQHVQVHHVFEIRGHAAHHLQLGVALRGQGLRRVERALRGRMALVHLLYVAVEDGVKALLHGDLHRFREADGHLPRALGHQDGIDRHLDEQSAGDHADLLVLGVIAEALEGVAGGQQLVHAEASDEAADQAPLARRVVHVGEREGEGQEASRMHPEAHRVLAGHEIEDHGEDDGGHIAQRSAEQPLQVLLHG